MKNPMYYINYFRAYYLNHATAAYKVNDFLLAKNISQDKERNLLQKQIKLLLRLNEFCQSRSEIPRENALIRIIRDAYVKKQIDKINALEQEKLKYTNLIISSMQARYLMLSQVTPEGVLAPMKKSSKPFAELDTSLE